MSLRTKDAELEHRSLHEIGLAAVRPVADALLTAHRQFHTNVQLSCAWARVLILPALAQLTREERWRNYARARFEQIYAASAQDWDIQLAGNWPGKDRVAVVWPTALREALAAHAHVRSVRVGLLEHLGVLLAQMPSFSGCLAQIESGGAGLLFVVAGRLCRVRWCRFEDAEGLAATAGAEWAGVQALESAEIGEAALALTSALSQDKVDQPRTAKLLASRLGISRAFSLSQSA
ncbi:MAG TPA: hypothetical protein VEE84_08065 [Burkholderiaceae bacterium]|nr:hypothetical protein [Burkholderiaceae bacterium]